jgi:hypothetical protein
MNHTEQKIKELEELATEFNNKLKDLREEAKREEFKVGDWVLVQGNEGSISTGNGITGKVISKLYDLSDVSFPNGGGNMKESSDFRVLYHSRLYTIRKEWVIRRATEEEVLTERDKIYITNHRVEFFPDHIQVGCTRVELETIKQIANHYKL